MIDVLPQPEGIRLAAEIGAEKMAKAKKSTRKSSKRSVSVRDLRVSKNPRGGATIKIGSAALKIK